MGVQRAGSSWWHRLLEAHPNVSPLGLGAKELHFFDDFWRGDFQPSDERAYHQLFLRPEGMLGGEWTPRYIFDPWTPPLLRRAAPDAKLLVLLRDPIARFRSGVTHAATHGGRVTSDVVDTAIARGFYAAQLSRLYQHFPREQVLVLQFERCRANPAPMLKLTLEFLGLDPGRYPSSIRLSEAAQCQSARAGTGGSPAARRASGNLFRRPAAASADRRRRDRPRSCGRLSACRSTPAAAVCVPPQGSKPGISRETRHKGAGCHRRLTRASVASTEQGTLVNR